MPMGEKPLNYILNYMHWKYMDGDYMNVMDWKGW